MTTLAELQAQIQRQARQRFALEIRRPLVYVALGASDAVGVGATDASHSYVELLTARLRRHYSPQRAVTVRNLAVSGYTILEIDRDELRQVSALAPDIVTLWTGGNDVIQSVETAEFGAALSHIMRLLQQSGAAVFVGTVPDLSLVPLVRAFPAWVMPFGDPVAYARRRSRDLGEIVQRLVPTYGGNVVSLPMSQILADPSLVASDGFHPSDAGHRRLAEAWWAEISKLLE
ncbi:MAG: SGNH/GDSL hydrolase family protein [Chloroflexota bacterium]